MSVSVELADLEARIEEFGPIALVVTVGSDSRAHVVSVAIALDGSELRSDVGRTTAGNATANPSVSIVWSARPGGDYCLIVDGDAAVTTDDESAELRVQPRRAVLHRIASASADLPSCVTVLDQRAAR